MDRLMRHIDACNNVTLPAAYLPFRLGPTRVGWLAPDFAALLAGMGLEESSSGVTLAEPAALPALARTLAERGALRWRNEAFDVRAHPDGPALTTVDRGALPKFGILAKGVHVNGLVRGGKQVWVAVRAADKALDPGKLDHIVAGGVPAGMTAMQTLVKEAGEEATLPPELAATATFVGRIRYAMAQPEGLRRDDLHCYDIHLPDGFVPQPGDGEVARFELWPIARVMAALRDGDDFKFNVAVVLIDLLIRLGLIVDAQRMRLRAALDRAHDIDR